MRIPSIACALVLASTSAWSQGLAESATAAKTTAHREAATRILASSSHSGGRNVLKTAGIGFLAGAAIGATIIAIGSGDLTLSSGEVATVVGLAGLAGGVIGIAVGAGIPAPSPASVDRGPVSAKPRRTPGLGLTMSVRF